MSLANLMRNAATFAQSQLAQLQGMSAGGTNTLINGAPYIGVYGSTEVREQMNPGGGHRKLRENEVALTRTQFDAPPPSQIPLTRTDLNPQVTYRIAKVDTDDPLFYILTISKVGP